MGELIEVVGDVDVCTTFVEVLGDLNVAIAVTVEDCEGFTLRQCWKLPTVVLPPSCVVLRPFFCFRMCVQHTVCCC